MILFSKDWQRYPNAIIDTETKNTSFVRLSSVYRLMGVKNHAFLLALINPELKGLDPFSHNLSLEQMAMVALECRENPWYFFREVARAPALAGRAPTVVEANRGNIALWWLFFNHVMTILTQIRQTGKSFSTDLLMTLLTNVTCRNTDINLLTKDDILRRKNIERLKEIADELPPYLNQKTREDTNNTEGLTIKSLGNTYTAHVPQASPKSAYKLGRGLTSPIFHVDEGPFQPNIWIALPAALAATGAAIEAAKSAGTPYGTILTTTAGKKDEKSGKYVYGLIANSASWTEMLFDCIDQSDLEKTIKLNSHGGVVRVNITLNYKQLGKTDAWLKARLDESLQVGDDASRDYFNIWTSGTETNPIPEATLEKISKSFIAPLYTDISKPHGYVTRWYVSEESIYHRLKTGQFALGIDTSDASGGDDIACILVDLDNLDVVMTGLFNETNLITFSEFICSILISHENITAIVERRSTGAAVLDYLLLMLPQHGLDPFKRLFNRIVNEYDENPDRYREIKTPMNRRDNEVYVRFKKTFGFATSATGYASRSEIYSTTLQNAAKRSCDRIYDRGLIDQINGLVTKNGRIDHDDGEHDDSVIAWLLCHWLILHGKNLSHYGIDVGRMMSNISRGSEKTISDPQISKDQQAIRERIETIYNELSRENDDYVSMRLEHELRNLDKQIVLEQGETFSLDQLIQQVRETKRNKKRNYEITKPNSSDYRKLYANNHMAQSSGVFSDRPLNALEVLGRR